MKNLLVTVAHPGDESLYLAGTIAKYAKAGWRVHLICASRGEKGGGSAPNEELGLERQKELEKAATLIGIFSITFLDYQDGTLIERNPGDIEDKIYREMLSYMPSIVLTFEPNGINNHPDHKKISLSTTFAFQKYSVDCQKNIVGPMKVPGRRSSSRQRQFVETESWKGEPKLYFACLPESVTTYVQKHKKMSFELPGVSLIGIPDKYITTIIDVRRFQFIKKEALLAHLTQKKDFDKFLLQEMQPFFHQEFFILRMQGTYEVIMGKTDKVRTRL